MCKITESDSNYDELEQMTTNQLLYNINKEDKTIARSVEKVIPSIEELVEVIVPKIESGGRLFYIGAGTSGRLGILDASECPPTFGVSHGLVIGIIAGGDTAIRKAVEFAEDDESLGWNDLQGYSINKKDVLIGIAASCSSYISLTIGGQKTSSEGILGKLNSLLFMNQYIFLY